MMENLSVLLPLLAFMGLMLAVSFAVRVRREKEGAGFVSQYFIGNRAIGGFVLAIKQDEGDAVCRTKEQLLCAAVFIPAPILHPASPML